MKAVKIIILRSIDYKGVEIIDLTVKEKRRVGLKQFSIKQKSDSYLPLFKLIYKTLIKDYL